MTEKEFEVRVDGESMRRLLAGLALSGGKEKESLGRFALGVAKEAGAPFDPEPIEPVVIFEAGGGGSADRLMLKPGGKRETFGSDFDGWEEVPGGVYRWERRAALPDGGWSEWRWQGNSRLMVELARLKLAEWGARTTFAIKGDWQEGAAAEWVNGAPHWSAQGEAIGMLAAIIRKYAPQPAPKVEDVVEAFADGSKEEWLTSTIRQVEKACLAAGLKRREG